ncbi:MAG: rod shape-determining protein MreD [Spirochaetaceae bacterium]|nr:rod shape-determining protein MreD [Spirochaetaceae bacterium]
MIRSVVSTFFLMFFVVLIETALLSNIFFLPAVPDLLLLVLLFLSVNNGSTFGEVSGFYSGFLLDFLSASPLGLNSLIRTVIGFLTGLFHKTLNVRGFFIPALMGFLGTLSKVILIQIISFFFPQGIITYNIFSTGFIFELILNTLLCPCVFFLLSLFPSFFVNNNKVV